MPELAQQQNAANVDQTSQQTPADNQTNASGNKSQVALGPDVAPIVTSATELQAEREQQRADADLQAQQDMAFYALLMVIATVATVLVTAVGVWFVKRTLDANLEFLKESQNATAAMLEANKQARIQTAAQVRANNFSLGISNAQPDGPRVSVSFNIKNYGATAASKIKLRLRFYAIEYKGQNLIKVGRKKFGIEWLKPEVGHLEEGRLFIERPADFWDLMAATKGVVLDVRLSFADIYGEIHSFKFCLQGSAIFSENREHGYIGDLKSPESWVVKAFRPK